MSHLCPGWGLHDCPHNARVPDEPEDADRCPQCEKRNNRWEMDLYLTGHKLSQVTEEIATTGSMVVFRAMTRAVDHD